jgi:hypothetical protein
MRKWLILSFCLALGPGSMVEAASITPDMRPTVHQPLVQHTGSIFYQCNRWCQLGQGWGVLARRCSGDTFGNYACEGWACYQSCPSGGQFLRRFR